MSLSPPRPLAISHDVSTFDCNRPQLDIWLKQRALKNEEAGASRTYVVCEGMRVVGYYSLATGAVRAMDAPGKIKRNMPDPIPVMLIGRLAVDRNFQGQGVGQDLLQDAIRRTLNAADIAGIRAILVHALDSGAVAYYRRNGFIESPIDPFVLFLPLATARKALK